MWQNVSYKKKNKNSLRLMSSFTKERGDGVDDIVVNLLNCVKKPYIVSTEAPAFFS
jgi:hypothetical protein